MPFPYTSTIRGLRDLLVQLRSFFPATLTADTLKAWNIASNNEGTVLGVIRFLGLIDEAGQKTPEAALFSEHDDSEFESKFGELIKDRYNKLFSDLGPRGWDLERNQLIRFFRSIDHSSARVGQQQAMTFEALAQFAGQSSSPKQSRPTGTTKKARSSRKSSTRKASDASESSKQAEKGETSMDVGKDGPSLTIRIEVNLPVSEDQKVYDRIFKSIKANLYP